MKKRKDIDHKPAQLTIHIGTEKVARRDAPLIHEKSVLEQLKKIIEKNNKIEEQLESSED